MVLRWFEGDGVDGVVVPAHRVEVGVGPDRLGHGRPGAHTAARGPARPANRPAPAAAPARATANWCGPLVTRHRTQAERTSSRPIATPAVREPGQVVARARSRMVKTADPVGAVVVAIATNGRYGTGTMAGNAGRVPHSTRHGKSTRRRQAAFPIPLWIHNDLSG
jgi:hypothetical protein